MIGTHTRLEYTDQTEDGLLLGRTNTGLGTSRMVETFNIDPNRIKQLQPHQGVVLIKQPFRYDLLQLDVCGGNGASIPLTPTLSHQGRGRRREMGTVPRGRGIDLRGYLRSLQR